MNASRMPADAHEQGNRERLRLVTEAMRVEAGRERPDFALLGCLEQIARGLRRQIRTHPG
jgi:hypothetical protein